MLSAIIVIVGISVLILLHELGHFIAAKKAGLRVDEFGFGFPPRMFSIKRGETRYSFNWLPFGGFVRIYGESKEQINQEAMEGKTPDTSRSFAHQSALRRSTIILAGIFMNFVLGWFILSAVFMIGAAQSVLITQVAPDSPAATAGFMVGDELVGFTKDTDAVAYIAQQRGKQTEFRVRRAGEELALVATPRVEPVVGEGALGVALSQGGFERLPFFSAIAEGLNTSWSVMGEIVKTFGRMIASLFTQGQLLEGVVGPVGIFGVAGDLGSIGFVYVLQLVGLISLNLAVLNAMPFPALDGGRFLFILIEKIKGSPLSPNKEMIFNLSGFAVLIVLMLAITARDIINLF